MARNGAESISPIFYYMGGPESLQEKTGRPEAAQGEAMANILPLARSGK
jgi:hypothetical protein